MKTNNLDSPQNQTVEIRAFNFLKKVFDERGWSFPHYLKLDKECSAKELAQALELPAEMIEAVFINGKAYQPEEGLVKPGDRVAFIPPGTPGPYRVLLGIKKLPNN